MSEERTDLRRAIEDGDTEAAVRLAAQLEQDLEITRRDLHEAWEQTRAMRGTLSWRITAPLRVARRRVGR